MRNGFVIALLGLSCMAGCSETPDEATSRWWKGNLHTHSFWSDGDDYPEMIIDWYKDAAYDFVALSEHNVLAEGERFIDVAENGGGELLETYKARFPDWVEERRAADGRHEVRLKTLAEYRTLFEEPGSFLLIPAEEITSGFEGKPIHVNATNIAELIEPRQGTSVRDVMQKNVDAVLEQRDRTGRAMFPHINHPNFGWAIKVEDLIALSGEKFFEVYNGHPQVHNEGDDLRPSTERMWDILLAERLSAGEELMYGIAVDDAHEYQVFDREHKNPGRGWVMVRAASLSAENIVTAMEAGDFYGSSGVTIDSIVTTASRMTITVSPEAGVSYRIRFIGTRRGYERTKEEVTLDDASVLYRYSDAIGETLAEVDSTSGTYNFRGDELYVRAKVISNKLKENPYRAGESEAAWIQPHVPPPPADEAQERD